jgi:AcrR family transcriptional regulator
MNHPPAPGNDTLVPVFSPERLGLAEGGEARFRGALERIAGEGELKAKLLLAALDHFAARGFDGVQVKEVAEEAGVSKPTLYYHFGSKEGLFRQLCLVALAVTEKRLKDMVAPHLASAPGDAAAVRASALRLSATYVDLLMELPQFTGFILRAIAVPGPDSTFRDLMPVVERALSPLGLYVNHVFRMDFEQARKEVMVYTAIFGALLEEHLRRPEYEIDAQEIAWAVDRWLRGIQGA